MTSAADQPADVVDHFPIRVVSQRTGVNTVTLRAWERRYGLLRPVRTAKGHRLYSSAEISRVETIVAWLNRGVSIGRVCGLLERGEPVGADELAGYAQGADWTDYGARVIDAVAHFDEHRLDDAVNEALALYPFVTVCERLLHPLGRNLAERWQGALGDGAERAFVEGYLKRKLAARVQLGAKHLSRHQHGAPVLLVALPGGVNRLALLILAVALQGLDQPPLLLPAALSADEILVAAERQAPVAIVLHGDLAQEPAALARLLARLVSAVTSPVVVTGHAARIHEKLIADCGAIAMPDESLGSVARRTALLVDTGIAADAASGPAHGVVAGAPP